MTRTKFTRTMNKLRLRALCAPRGRKTARMKDLRAFVTKALKEGI